MSESESASVPTTSRIDSLDSFNRSTSVPLPQDPKRQHEELPSSSTDGDTDTSVPGPDADQSDEGIHRGKRRRVETPSVAEEPVASSSSSTQASSSSETTRTATQSSSFHDRDVPPSTAASSTSYSQQVGTEESETESEDGSDKGPRRAPSVTDVDARLSHSPLIDGADRDHASGSGTASTTSARKAPSPAPEPVHEPFSAYSCPICFCPPINATLTPCGHICCGSCLFTAIKTTTQRAQTMMVDPSPSCPVCRAVIPGWDGKGGGVIGLSMRVVLSL